MCAAKSVNSVIITVDDMTNAVRDALYLQPSLQSVAVRGELLGFKLHTSGHAYFSLLGANSRVACVLFRSYASGVASWPKDGDEVLVRGRVDVYGARGSYQIYATSLSPLGAGAKARAKEALRQKLEKEGVFDPRLKRPLPRYPERVAVITSLTGAALWDILKLHALRYPCAEIVIVPSLMQGLDARDDILRAFDSARKLKDVSCVIFARGGGSRDDLDVFDDEAVVRAVRLSPVPVITGLGHQIDFTLSDMAADAFAPTPSGAAERVFPDAAAVSNALLSAREAMRARLVSRIALIEKNILNIKERLDRNLLKERLVPALEKNKRLEERMFAAVSSRLKAERASLDGQIARLAGASPLAPLARGYAVCRNADGAAIRSASEFKAGEKFSVTMKDGRVEALTESVVLSNEPAGGAVK